MAAHEKLSGLQFNYDTPDLGTSTTYHRVTAVHPTGGEVGTLMWTNKRIANVVVRGDQQRRGVATSMWNEGQRLASESSRIPAPKHSSDRTNAGDAWARSVGGRLPRRHQQD
jgi:hypothetical protein